MSGQLLVSTRKGVFFLERNGSPRWRIKRTAFLADNVSMTLADPRDGALYAALDHGHFSVKLHRSRDGGKSFDVLRKGLPQRHAYDLILRHGMDVDETGNTLAVGSSTGSLWLSEDQGDSWHTLSEHLPPIYSVRFTKN